MEYGIFAEGNGLEEKRKQGEGRRRAVRGKSARSKASHLAIYSNKTEWYLNRASPPQNADPASEFANSISAKRSFASRWFAACTAPQSRTEEGTKYTENYPLDAALFFDQAPGVRGPTTLFPTSAVAPPWAQTRLLRERPSPDQLPQIFHSFQPRPCHPTHQRQLQFHPMLVL